jgi:hypothetical protein
MKKINKFLVLKVLYTFAMIFCVIHGFFFAQDITIFGLDMMIVFLSGAAILVVEHAEITSLED